MRLKYGSEKLDIFAFKMTIIVSNFCLVNCKHCFWKVKNTQVMEQSFLRNILDYAINELHISRITFSGGEPTLHWEMIQNTISPFLKYKLYISVCTNAFWASTRQKAETVCKKLKEFGVKRLEISTDKYHQEYIPLDYIKNAVAASELEGIETVLIVCINNDEEIIGYLPYKIYFKNTKIVFQHVANIGNAQSIDNCKVPYKDLKGLKCSQIGNISVDYLGNLYACCGPYLQDNEQSPLYLGKAQDHVDISKVLNENIKLKTIALSGFDSLMNDFEKQNTYSSLCELCQLVLNHA